MRMLVREIVANSLLKPTLDLVSDPDFINQTIIWMCGAGGGGGSGGTVGARGPDETHSASLTGSDEYKIKPDVFIRLAHQHIGFGEGKG